jgi:prophage maintenance system killer protein
MALRSILWKMCSSIVQSVPDAHLLTDGNKAERMKASLSFLQHYAIEGNNYVHQVMW